MIMKKIITSFILFLIVFNAFGQEEQKEPKNEIKLNVAYLIGGIPEVGYEYLINEESSVGADFLFSIDNSVDFLFAFTPYYRFYFGKKRTAGFFVEGFGMLNITENNYDIIYYDDIILGNSYDINDNTTNFALGFAVGAKFLTKSGFVFEFYGGIGRNLFETNNNDYTLVPRFGITLGKRF